MKKALLQVLVMLKFRLKWQSNQAPKFLRGSVLGEMMDPPIVRVVKVKRVDPLLTRMYNAMQFSK